MIYYKLGLYQIVLIQPRCVRTDLFSRAVASRVSSALLSLTSVFGMGTGGPSAFVAQTVRPESLRGLPPRPRPLPEPRLTRCWH